MRGAVCRSAGLLVAVFGAAGCVAGGSERIERNFAASPAPVAAQPALAGEAPSVVKGGVTVRIGYGEYRLETLTATPAGPGPFPLAAISHGVPAFRDVKARERTRLRRYLPLALDFAGRGYKAVIFARRGFASSSGPYQEGYSCRDDSGLSLTLAARNGAIDYAALVEALAARPDVDGSQVLAIGQSGGGLAVSALASKPPPGLIGVVNFAGGRSCNPDALVRTFGAFGEDARVPALWLYSTTDRLFGPGLVDRALDAYAAHGAPVRLERVGAISASSDGHLLYRGEERGTWRPLLDAFLDAIGAPNRKPVS